MDTFLDKISKKLIEKFGTSMLDVTVILPNRRSKIFLIEQLKQNSEHTIFAPNICSIQEFAERISGLRSLDTMEQLFEFYNVYTEVSDKKEKQAFEQFAPWAKVLLKDFSEIDAYLLEPNNILQYLKDIKDLEHWSVSEKRTEIIEKHLKFWTLLPKYYHAFYTYLITQKAGYQGLIYREAAENIQSFSDGLKSETFVFAGFNALMPSEEKIIKHLLRENKAAIYWDTDRAYLEDNYNQAGYFTRKIKQNWSYYKSNPFEWIVDEFSKDKDIHIIGAAKSIGQAKVVGEILEKQLAENPESLSKTALILSEKSLLIPVLYSLPESVGTPNITLEYSARNNPIQFLINRLFKLHTYANGQKSNSYTFYYKDVLEVLSNPFVEPFVKANGTANTIKINNFTFINHKKLFELQKEEKTDLFNLIFEQWPTDALLALDRISDILLLIKAKLSNDTEADRITLAFVYEIFKVINKLKNYFSIAKSASSLKNLYAVYKQVIDSAEVSFEGEPLTGMQIMGILESRTLDFEHVIFTSVNEGKIPFGKSQNSFIPYDVKREFGLPTYNDRDAIYTYHFYRLLQRAKKVYLIYNTEDEGFDSGEKSRFITQLKIENLPNHNLIEEIYNSTLPTEVQNEIIIEKSDDVMEVLKVICEKGFSPSSLASYIRNPIDFYFQRILKINESKEVEETIEANTLGNIIHTTLEKLYKPYENKYLSLSIIDNLERSFEEILLDNFKEVFKEGSIQKGKNLLAFESAKRSISNFLRLEKQLIADGDAVRILYLEKRFEQELMDSRLPFPVKIAGVIDRIEERNGNIRIVDYKTGKVEKGNLTLNNWQDFLSNEKKDKIIQLLSYVFMYSKHAGDMPMETGIISFKNLKSGFLPFVFIEDKEKIQHITPEIVENFKEETVQLLVEILDKNIPFITKKN